MRAAKLRGPRDVVVVDDASKPEPRAGEVRVRMEGSGVCGSDAGPWRGVAAYPLEAGAPGHEGWGVVDAVGDGVTDVAPGDRVAGLFQHAFAEFDVTDAASAVRVPDALAGRDAPAEPIACAFNAFRRSGIETGQTVAVVGVGFLGAILTRLAADAGANVIAITRRASALAVAERMGARHLVELTDTAKAAEAVAALTDNRLCERVLECAGKQASLDLATSLTRTRGRLVVVGYHQDGPRTVDMRTWNWRGIDVVNAHERDPAEYVRGMREALEAAASGRLDPSPLITHRFRLDDIGRAFETLEARPDGFMKAVVSP